MSIFIKANDTLVPAVTFPDRIEVEPWVRPADWLPLPVVSEGEQKCVALFAVESHGSNYCTVIATGAFTVDWGDGTAPENFASGATALRQHDYAALPANTVSTRGYKQVIVTITPQSGQSLTTLALASEPGVISGSSFVSAMWLDIEGSGPLTAPVTLATTSQSTALRSRYLERFVWRGATSILNYTGAFRSLHSLQHVELTTTGGNNFSSMFTECYQLRTIPLIDTSAGTTCNAMFADCRSLVKIPLLDTRNTTNTSSMFTSCSSLLEAPRLDLAKVTAADNMFTNCASLTEIHDLHLPLVGAMNSMFQNCYSLRQAPAMFTPNATTFSSLFNGCTALQSAPAYDIPKVTTLANVYFGCFSMQVCGGFTNSVLVNTAASAFQNCYSLQAAPPMDTSAVTSFSGTFNGCRSLIKVPAYNTGAATTVQNMFFDCYTLREIPALNVAGVNSSGNFTTVFGNCGLVKVGIFGARFGFSLTANVLTAEELNRVYTNLGTASGAQTLSVANNPGVAGDDPTIATAKGWTVTGT